MELEFDLLENINSIVDQLVVNMGIEVHSETIEIAKQRIRNILMQHEYHKMKWMLAFQEECLEGEN